MRGNHEGTASSGRGRAKYRDFGDDPCRSTLPAARKELFQVPLTLGGSISAGPCPPSTEQ